MTFSEWINDLLHPQYEFVKVDPETFRKGDKFFAYINGKLLEQTFHSMFHGTDGDSVTVSYPDGWSIVEINNCYLKRKRVKTLSNITDAEIEELAAKEFPFSHEWHTGNRVSSARRGFVAGFKQAIKNYSK